jgi:hypothetical protein
MGTVGESETFLHRIIDAVSFRVLPDRRNLITGLVDLYVEPTIYLHPANPEAPAVPVADGLAEGCR